MGIVKVPKWLDIPSKYIKHFYVIVSGSGINFLKD